MYNQYDGHFLFFSHLSCFPTITAERIVETTYDYVHKFKKNTHIIQIKFVYEMEKSKRFKMAAI